jgi:hypothetical protein
MFALVSPTVTQTPSQAQARAAAGVANKNFSGGEDDLPGSTESLFEALAHCARKSDARQLVQLCIDSENGAKVFLLTHR